MKKQQFFCNLEKHNYSTKIIPFVEKEDGSFIYDQKEVLKGTNAFYEKLYAKVDTVDNYSIENDLDKCNAPKLSCEQSLALEGLLWSGNTVSDWYGRTTNPLIRCWPWLEA